MNLERQEKNETIFVRGTESSNDGNPKHVKTLVAFPYTAGNGFRVILNFAKVEVNDKQVKDVVVTLFLEPGEMIYLASEQSTAKISIAKQRYVNIFAAPFKSGNGHLFDITGLVTVVSKQNYEPIDNSRVKLLMGSGESFHLSYDDLAEAYTVE